MGKYCVYKHTTPANKFYFGITEYQDNPNLRFCNGLGYRTQTVFFNAIVKYGWDNIKHEIVEYNLSLDDAIEKEKYYIETYKTNVSKYGHQANGYNMTTGGDTLPLVDRTIMEERVWSKTRKPVDCYDINNNYLATYSSAKEAATKLNCSIHGVRGCAIGKTNVCGGKYRFTYHEKKLKPITAKLYKRHVYMFDFYGNFIKDFNSCSEASRYIVGSNSATSIISACAKGKRGSFRGYVWSYSEKPTLITRQKRKCRSVDMYSKDGVFIKTFESITAASRAINPDGKTINSIQKCCNSTGRTAYGYIWKYHCLDDFRVNE